MTETVFLNGGYRPLKSADVHVTDRGFLYGDGIFDTMRAYRGVPFRIDDHVARLFGSAEALRIKIPLTQNALKDGIRKLLEKNKVDGDAYIRTTVTRGSGKFGPAIRDDFEATVLAVALPLAPVKNEHYTDGVAAIVSSVARNPDSPLNRHKTLNYLESILARDEAKREGAFEALFRDRDGACLEGASSNLFIVKGGQILTPSADGSILPGIARAVVLELSPDAEERNITVDELKAADEAFITNSIVGVVPLVKVDGQDIGAGRVGKTAKALVEKFAAKVEEETGGAA